MEHPTIPQPIANIRIAFSELVHHVDIALQTHIGDTRHLDQLRDECLTLSAIIEQACTVSRNFAYIDYLFIARPPPIGQRTQNP